MKVEQCRADSKIEELCSLLGYSRQAYYQGKKHQEKVILSEELLLQEVNGHRKLMKRLGARKLLIRMQLFIQQHGIGIGRDAFFDLLREHGLLIRKRKSRKPITTNSKHWLKKYPNLIEDFIPVAANQLWVSDITYIHIGKAFAYLSLITDAYSRKIVGFYLSQNLSAIGCERALRMALKSLPEKYRLIHHSDRGVQYCSTDYVKLLKKYHIRISMTQTGDPLDNAIAERVNGILKSELLENIYSDYNTARYEVAKAISTYNHLRPHSSVDMLTPVEAHDMEGFIKKRWKNYYVLKKEREVLMV